MLPPGVRGSIARAPNPAKIPGGVLMTSHIMDSEVHGAGFAPPEMAAVFEAWVYTGAVLHHMRGVVDGLDVREG